MVFGLGSSKCANLGGRGPFELGPLGAPLHNLLQVMSPSSEILRDLASSCFVETLSSLHARCVHLIVPLSVRVLVCVHLIVPLSVRVLVPWQSEHCGLCFWYLLFSVWCLVFGV